MEKTKTWSRETALALLAVFIWAVYQNNVEMVEVIVWPITTYAAIAYGLKRVDQSDGMWSAKPPSSTHGRDQRSSQRPSRGDQYPDHRPDKPDLTQSNSETER